MYFSLSFCVLIFVIISSNSFCVFILDKATSIVGIKYGADKSADIRLRVVADHTRTAAFLIADGVIPGNEGRGYVLRRMMRRVIRNMRILGADKPVIKDLIESTIKAMGPQYPELNTDKNRILEIAIGEGTTFTQTLKTGTQLFESSLNELKKKNSQLKKVQLVKTIKRKYSTKDGLLVTDLASWLEKMDF